MFALLGAVLTAVWGFVTSLFSWTGLFWLAVVAFAYWTAWKNAGSVRRRKWYRPTWPWAALILLCLALPASAQATYRHDGPALLPDSVLTPGAIATSDTAVICHRSTKTVRHTTQATKAAVYREYGITRHAVGAYEVDHLVPLELGGKDTITNLWPEPAKPLPGFRQKDAAENELHRLVCSGEVPIDSAQAWIRDHWYTTYRAIVGVPKR